MYNALYALFEQAVSNKLKYPKIHVTMSTDTLVVKLAGDKSRYTGQLMLTNDAGYGASNNKYFGRIENNGGLVAGRDLTPEVESFLQKLAADPIGTLAENGKLHGNCCFCQKALTDPTSAAVGYGKVCSTKYSLPWHAARASRKSSKEENAVVDNEVIAYA